MKRTNLVLDEQVLEEARKALGARTYSETVNTSLREMVRTKRVESIAQYLGTGLHWDGNLPEMREDSVPPKRRTVRGKRR
jgi:Arc/MetJ family transcription regulator